MTIETTNELHKLAAGSEFAFSAKHGGSIDVVAGSSKATNAASQIIASLGNAASVGKEAFLTTTVAGAASLAALGDISPLAIGVGAMAGVISSVSKGRNG